MAQSIQLANHTEITVNNNDFQVEVEGNQLHFSFAGLHNKTFTDREVLLEMPFFVRARGQRNWGWFSNVGANGGNDQSPR